MIVTSLLIGLLVVTAVLIHYEALYRLPFLMQKEAIRPRYRIVTAVLGSLCAHIFEVWLFAFGYYFMVSSGRFGTLQGNFNGTLLDCGYLSFTTFSSLGIGDVEPVGHIRFLVAMEALTGLVLITWTASFMFAEMQRLWGTE
jgi:Ion channel